MALIVYRRGGKMVAGYGLLLLLAEFVTKKKKISEPLSSNQLLTENYDRIR